MSTYTLISFSSLTAYLDYSFTLQLVQSAGNCTSPPDCGPVLRFGGFAADRTAQRTGRDGLPIYKHMYMYIITYTDCVHSNNESVDIATYRTGGGL